jgi:ABC-type antimicrobial peptide transport system permease subunit
MRPYGIIKGILQESFLLLILGMLIGNGLGFLSVYLLSSNGIDLSFLAAGMEFVGLSRIIYPTVLLKDVITANLVVFVLGLLVSLYPAFRATRFTPVEAMAHT